MINYNAKKILSVSAVAIVASLVLLMGASSVAQLPQHSLNTPQIGTNALPPYNITFEEKGLPANTYWELFGYTSGAYGYYSSSTPYINLTNVYNGSYYFYFYSESAYSNTYNPHPQYTTIIVSGANVKDAIHFTNVTNAPSATYYQANLSISNMPTSIPGTPQWSWSVIISGVNVAYNQTGTSYTGSMNVYGLTNGTYNYWAYTSGYSTAASTLYHTYLTPASGQFTVNGHNIVKSFNFKFAKNYNIKFSETGLPSSQAFMVDIYSTYYGAYLGNSSYVSMSPNVDFNLPNGTYYYYISSTSGYYSPSPSTGTLNIQGSSDTVSVSFGISKATYSVTFHIANLPANIPGSNFEWAVYFNGSSYFSVTPTIHVGGLLNGTYFYQAYVNGNMAFSNYAGSVTIAGKDSNVSLMLEKAYTLTMKVANLSKFQFSPPPIDAVIVQESTGYSNSFDSSNGTLIVSGLVNGTYSYTLSTPPPYTISPASGTFTVNGTSVSITLHSTEGAFYLVHFTESGIPLYGTGWGVVIDNGFTYNNSYVSPGLSSSSSPLPFLMNLPNGTYSVQAFIYSNGHYHFTAPKTVTVSGKDVNMSFTFSATGSSYLGAGISNGLLLLVGIAVVIVIAALATVFIVRRRGKGES